MFPNIGKAEWTPKLGDCARAGEGETAPLESEPAEILSPDFPHCFPPSPAFPRIWQHPQDRALPGSFPSPSAASRCSRWPFPGSCSPTRVPPVSRPLGRAVSPSRLPPGCGVHLGGGSSCQRFTSSISHPTALFQRFSPRFPALRWRQCRGQRSVPSIGIPADSVPVYLRHPGGCFESTKAMPSVCFPSVLPQQLSFGHSHLICIILIS